MHEGQFERLLRETAQEYRRPGATPRREMWLRLQHARAARRTRPLRRKEFHPLAWATGIAALLAIGVGLGRLSVKQPGVTPESVAAVAGPPTNTSAYQITAAEHLGQAEVFLTLFRMSVQRGRIDPLVSATARPLLATNRLLIDSPAGADPQTRTLLEDLELVLARIAQLSPRPRPEDLELITTGIDHAGIMARLWGKAPTGPAGTSGT